jgi:hypothetical protein
MGLDNEDDVMSAQASYRGKLLYLDSDSPAQYNSLSSN